MPVTEDKARNIANDQITTVKKHVKVVLLSNKGPGSIMG